MAKKHIIQKMLLAVFWCLVGAGTVVLLVAAIQKKGTQLCRGIDINIRGVNNNFFVDKNDILETISVIAGAQPVGRSIGSFDLNEMELALARNIWVKNAQLFFDNNDRLQVNVLEREPVARIFTTSGTTFYIDSARAILPLSDKFSARLPVFTNFPSDKKVLIKADSNLLSDILVISYALQQDAFHMAMIEQIDITPNRTFEMIPKFGNTLIVFGDAKMAKKKFDKLQLFYNTVVVKAGWNKYSEINVQYINQVVAKRKDAAEFKADSLHTLRLMQVIAENAARMAADTMKAIAQDNEQNTTNKSIIQHSIERDDHSAANSIIENSEPPIATETEKPAENNAAPVILLKPLPATTTRPATMVKKPVEVTSSNASEKPFKKPAATSSKQPKVVMPKPVKKKVQLPDNEY